MAKVDISGLDKAAVLAALYNNSQPSKRGPHRFNTEEMTVEDAHIHLEEGDDIRKQFGNKLERNPLYFDYLQGRLLKVNLSGDSFYALSYDRHLGDGLAARVIENLRKTGSITRLPPCSPPESPESKSS